MPRKKSLTRTQLLGCFILGLPYLYDLLRWGYGGLHNESADLGAIFLSIFMLGFTLILLILAGDPVGRGSKAGFLALSIGAALASVCAFLMNNLILQRTQSPLASAILIVFSFGLWMAAVKKSGKALWPIEDLLTPGRPFPELRPKDLAARYEPAPSEADRCPVLGPRQGDILVESGSFRVDLGRAMEKLRDFNLADPDAFLLPWIRCAVASGARRVSVERARHGLRLQFDGSPLPEASMSDPYACLLDGSIPERERGLYLARGLLGAMRHRPRLVRIATGGGTARSCLRVGPGADQDREEPPSTPLNSIEVLLDAWWPRWEARRFLACLEPLFAVERVCFVVNAKALPDAGAWTETARIAAAEREPGFRFQRHSIDLPIPGSDAGQNSRLYLFKHGVLVGEYPVESAELSVALVNDDRLTLDLSGGDVVRDEFWRAAVKRVGWKEDVTIGPRPA